jgi:hypothetical protein
MTKSKQAKKSTEQTKPAVAVPVVQPAVAAPATPLASTSAPAQPSKQQQTIDKLIAGWAEKGVPINKLTINDDGKFKLLIPGEGWPTIRVGGSGGITVMELHSYAKAYDAALDGLALYEKQKARKAKKASAAAQPKAPAAVKATTEAVTA